MSLPHDSWAQHYDLVLDRTFGDEYQAFTERTLDTIAAVVSPPARIVDFGAGTGRLSVPLAKAGYRVTAVDPSVEMLARLRQKAAGLPIEVVDCRMQDYSGGPEHDLALCVFTVLVYMLDEEALRSAVDAAAAALRPGGLFLVDVPSTDVFEGFEFDTTDVIRCVEIEPVAEALFRYHERTAVMQDGIPKSFEDRFDIRHWKPDEVRGALEDAGFRVRDDLTDRFASWGASYLLLER